MYLCREDDCTAWSTRNDLNDASRRITDIADFRQRAIVWRRKKKEMLCAKCVSTQTLALVAGPPLC